MKTNIIIGVVVLLIVIIVGWYITGSVTAPATVEEGDTKEAMVADEAGTEDMVSGKGSLLGLLALGKSQECTFVVRTNGMVQEGTAFYEGGNARVDTLIKGAGTGDIASYMIMQKDSNTMYMWGSAQGNQGIKMTLPTETTPTSMNDSQTLTDAPAVTPDMDVDYNCKPWRADRSVFVPPTDIEFMDMSEMQKMMEGMGGMMPGV
jgi:hypothetical protein